MLHLILLLATTNCVIANFNENINENVVKGINDESDISNTNKQVNKENIDDVTNISPNNDSKQNVSIDKDIVDIENRLSDKDGHNTERIRNEKPFKDILDTKYGIHSKYNNRFDKDRLTRQLEDNVREPLPKAVFYHDWLERLNHRLLKGKVQNKKPFEKRSEVASYNNDDETEINSNNDSDWVKLFNHRLLEAKLQGKKQFNKIEAHNNDDEKEIITDDKTIYENEEKEINTANDNFYKAEKEYVKQMDIDLNRGYKKLKDGNVIFVKSLSKKERNRELLDKLKKVIKNQDTNEGNGIHEEVFNMEDSFYTETGKYNNTLLKTKKDNSKSMHSRDDNDRNDESSIKNGTTLYDIVVFNNIDETNTNRNVLFNELPRQEVIYKLNDTNETRKPYVHNKLPKEGVNVKRIAAVHRDEPMSAVSLENSEVGDEITPNIEQSLLPIIESSLKVKEESKDNFSETIDISDANESKKNFHENSSDNIYMKHTGAVEDTIYSPLQNINHKVENTTSDNSDNIDAKHTKAVGNINSSTPNTTSAPIRSNNGDKVINEVIKKLMSTIEKDLTKALSFLKPNATQNAENHERNKTEPVDLTLRRAIHVNVVEVNNSTKSPEERDQNLNLVREKVIRDNTNRNIDRQNVKIDQNLLKIKFSHNDVENKNKHLTNADDFPHLLENLLEKAIKGDKISDKNATKNSHNFNKSEEETSEENEQNNTKSSTDKELDSLNSKTMHREASNISKQGAEVIRTWFRAEPLTIKEFSDKPEKLKDSNEFGNSVMGNAQFLVSDTEYYDSDNAKRSKSKNISDSKRKNEQNYSNSQEKMEEGNSDSKTRKSEDLRDVKSNNNSNMKNDNVASDSKEKIKDDNSDSETIKKKDLHDVKSNNNSNMKNENVASDSKEKIKEDNSDSETRKSKDLDNDEDDNDDDDDSAIVMALEDSAIIFYGFTRLVQKEQSVQDRELNEEPEEPLTPEENVAANYHEFVGIPGAELLMKEEMEPDIEALKKNDQHRIINGTAAGIGAFPYLGGLIVSLDSGKLSVCGSSLINQHHVVTAAHCGMDNRHVANKVEVVFGSLKLFSGGERYNVTKVMLHRDYNSKYLQNDVCVMTLPKVKFSAHVKPVRLATLDIAGNLVGKTAVVIGFGRYSDSKGITYKQSLHFTKVPIVDNALCVKTFGNRVVTDSQLCARGDLGGTCTGDSGGPMVITYNGAHILVGITSFGSPRGCEGRAPLGFSRVTCFKRWIDAHSKPKHLLRDRIDELRSREEKPLNTDKNTTNKDDKEENEDANDKDTKNDEEKDVKTLKGKKKLRNRDGTPLNIDFEEEKDDINNTDNKVKDIEVLRDQKLRNKEEKDDNTNETDYIDDNLTDNTKDDNKNDLRGVKDIEETENTHKIDPGQKSLKDLEHDEAKPIEKINNANNVDSVNDKVKDREVLRGVKLQEQKGNPPVDEDYSIDTGNDKEKEIEIKEKESNELTSKGYENTVSIENDLSFLSPSWLRVAATHVEHERDNKKQDNHLGGDVHNAGRENDMVNEVVVFRGIKKDTKKYKVKDIERKRNAKSNLKRSDYDKITINTGSTLKSNNADFKNINVDKKERVKKQNQNLRYEEDKKLLAQKLQEEAYNKEALGIINAKPKQSSMKMKEDNNMNNPKDSVRTNLTHKMDNLALRDLEDETKKWVKWVSKIKRAGSHSNNIRDHTNDKRPYDVRNHVFEFKDYDDKGEFYGSSEENNFVTEPQDYSNLVGEDIRDIPFVRIWDKRGGLISSNKVTHDEWQHIDKLNNYKKQNPPLKHKVIQNLGLTNNRFRNVPRIKVGDDNTALNRIPDSKKLGVTNNNFRIRPRIKVWDKEGNMFTALNEIPYDENQSIKKISNKDDLLNDLIQKLGVTDNSFSNLPRIRNWEKAGGFFHVVNRVNNDKRLNNKPSSNILPIESSQEYRSPYIKEAQRKPNGKGNGIITIFDTSVDTENNEGKINENIRNRIKNEPRFRIWRNPANILTIFSNPNKIFKDVQGVVNESNPKIRNWKPQTYKLGTITNINNKIQKHSTETSQTIGDVETKAKIQIWKDPHQSTGYLTVTSDDSHKIQKPSKVSDQTDVEHNAKIQIWKDPHQSTGYLTVTSDVSHKIQKPNKVSDQTDVDHNAKIQIWKDPHQSTGYLTVTSDVSHKIQKPSKVSDQTDVEHNAKIQIWKDPHQSTGYLTVTSDDSHKIQKPGKVSDQTGDVENNAKIKIWKDPHQNTDYLTVTSDVSHKIQKPGKVSGQADIENKAKIKIWKDPHQSTSYLTVSSDLQPKTQKNTSIPKTNKVITSDPQIQDWIDSKTFSKASAYEKRHSVMTRQNTDVFENKDKVIVWNKPDDALSTQYYKNARRTYSKKPRNRATTEDPETENRSFDDTRSLFLIM